MQARSRCCRLSSDACWLWSVGVAFPQLASPSSPVRCIDWALLCIRAVAGHRDLDGYSLRSSLSGRKLCVGSEEEESQPSPGQCLEGKEGLRAGPGTGKPHRGALPSDKDASSRPVAQFLHRWWDEHLIHGLQSDCARGRGLAGRAFQGAAPVCAKAQW